MVIEYCNIIYCIIIYKSELTSDVNGVIIILSLSSLYLIFSGFSLFILVCVFNYNLDIFIYIILLDTNYTNTKYIFISFFVINNIIYVFYFNS